MLAFALLLAVGLIQGVGLVLILPFLHLVGIGGDGGSGSLPPSADWLVSAAEGIGIPWTLPSVLIFFTLSVTLVSVLKYGQTIQNSNLVRLITCEFQIRFYRQWLFRPWIESSQQSSGEVLNLVQRDIGQLSQFLSTTLQLSTTALLTLVYLVVALQISAPLTGIALGTGAVLFIILIPLRRRMLSLSTLIRGGFSGQYNLIAEHLNSLKLIKAFARESEELAYLAESTREVQSYSHRITTARALTGLIQGILGAVLLAVIVYTSVTHFTVDSARLILLVFLFSRIVPQLMQLQQTWQRLLTTFPSLKAIAEHDPGEETPAIAEKDKSIELNADIEITNLAFAWPGNNESVFESFSQTIPFQQITAIAGESGSGKSTLCQLLLGLIEPDDGSIKVNGAPLLEERRRTWKQSIGYVPQNDFLFSQSIRDNLLWAKSDASEEEIWDSLTAASAAGFVKGLPNELDTVVSEKGDSLSGGERQRIAVARALIRNPTLLILDEPTSALDAENEAVFRDVLSQQSGVRTVVIISHRTSLVEIADHVIDLSKG